MSGHVFFLISYMVFVVLYILFLLIYSTYFKKSDDTLSKMLQNIADAGNGEEVSRSFVLEKSMVALSFVCLSPLFSIMFLCALLFASLTVAKFCLDLFCFILFAFGSLAFFGDYFLSVLVIENNKIYIRCLKTLFRPLVVQIDGSQKYQEINVGPFMLYVKYYFASIWLGSSSFVIMNVKNKKQLRTIFEIINAS